MTYYSHNNEKPVKNIQKIEMPDGSRRTYPFTTEDLNEAGYIVVDNPPAYNSNTHKLGWNGAWLVEELTELELQEVLQAAWEVLDEDIAEMIARAGSELITADENRSSILMQYIQDLRAARQNAENPYSVEFPIPPPILEE